MICFETFKEFGDYEISKMEQNEPSCFNGFVRVKKFRVTIEPIEEPKEVYAERLAKLWNTKNMRDIEPLKIAAKKLGVQMELL